MRMRKVGLAGDKPAESPRVISAEDEMFGRWEGRNETKNVQITHSQNLGIWIPKTCKWLDLLVSASPAVRTTLCGTHG